MKNKKRRFTIFLSVLIALSVVFATFFGIRAFRNRNIIHEGGYDESFDFYTITKNDNGIYSVEITDKNGNSLFSKQDLTKEPCVEQVNRRILGLTVQTGTGLSTNWAIYCDVENSKVSETCYYVLLAQGDYVIYANRENDEHSIIVQNIFDKSKYYKKHILTDCSPVAADFTTGEKLNGEGVAIITYLTGDDYAEKEITINFP